MVPVHESKAVLIKLDPTATSLNEHVNIVVLVPTEEIVLVIASSAEAWSKGSDYSVGDNQANWLHEHSTFGGESWFVIDSRAPSFHGPEHLEPTHTDRYFIIYCLEFGRDLTK